MPQGGQGLGTGSSRTRTVDQGSALHPACACPAPPERQRRPASPVPPAPRRGTDQRFRWSASMWSPPPESNRRPHPYHESRTHRCANQRFRSSPATADRQVMCSSLVGRSPPLSSIVWLLKREGPTAAAAKPDTYYVAGIRGTATSGSTTSWATWNQTFLGKVEVDRSALCPVAHQHGAEGHGQRCQYRPSCALDCPDGSERP
jgi:hypothetical protein